jgi:hypothetical protein
MPSHLHEALLLLFRNRPALAPELLREALHVQLPDYTDVRIDSADLTDIQPAEYRADLVVLPAEDAQAGCWEHRLGCSTIAWHLPRHTSLRVSERRASSGSLSAPPWPLLSPWSLCCLARRNQPVRFRVAGGQ